MVRLFWIYRYRIPSVWKSSIQPRYIKISKKQRNFLRASCRRGHHFSFRPLPPWNSWRVQLKLNVTSGNLDGWFGCKTFFQPWLQIDPLLHFSSKRDWSPFDFHFKFESDFSSAHGSGHSFLNCTCNYASSCTSDRVNFWGRSTLFGKKFQINVWWNFRHLDRPKAGFDCTLEKLDFFLCVKVVRELSKFFATNQWALSKMMAKHDADILSGVS